MRTYTRKTCLAKSINYFNGDDLAAEVFVSKYALSDGKGNYFETTPRGMHKRLAKEFARMEKRFPNPMSEDEIFDLLDGFRQIVPQGSPMSAVGNPYQMQSTSNCFVIQSPYDSYAGILKTDQEIVQIAKRRGGVGLDISTIRPRGLATANAAKTTDGIGVFMQRYSNSTREVAQNGRRGALMQTCSIHHPEIRTFINIKRDKTKVTGANLSVRLSDEFLQAVDDGTDVELRWPINAAEPTIVEYTDARVLWEEIIENAWASAEPGLLFWDTAIRMTPSDIYTDEGFGSVSTNPCGEIILSPYDSCRLLLINLKSFVLDPFTSEASFDWIEFAKVVQKAQRLMDDLIELELERIDMILDKIDKDPEPDEVKSYERLLWMRVRDACSNGRRTGLGVTAVGDAVAALGIRYGSADSIATVEKIYKTLAVNSYTSSIIMAKERGKFPVCNVEKESGHTFIERIKAELPPHILEMYQQYGRRNIANTTTAPAGSVSCMTQTTSGIEPAYKLEYTRRRKLMEGETLDPDFIDDSGDRWVEYDVYHHGFREWMEVSGQREAKDSPYWKSTSDDIDWINKVKLQAAAQKWVCHAISNTTNVPADTPMETIKEIYMTGWKYGCKGVTVYRDGCRDGVLVQKNGTFEQEYEIVLEDGVVIKAKDSDTVEWNGEQMSVADLRTGWLTA